MTYTVEKGAASANEFHGRDILLAQLTATAASLVSLAATMEAHAGRELRAPKSSARRVASPKVSLATPDLFARASPRPPAANIEGGEPSVAASPPEVASPVALLVYVAGCVGLRRLSRRLAREHTLSPTEGCCYKIGVVTRARSASTDMKDHDLSGRISALGTDRYGGTVVDAWGGTHAVDGHAAWSLCALGVKKPPSDPRIAIRTRCIEISLPAGASVRAFDASLRRALAPHALHERFPYEARHTNYADLGERRRRDLAREIYVGIDPIAGGDMLVAAVERAMTAYEQNGSTSPGDRAPAGRQHIDRNPSPPADMMPGCESRRSAGERKPKNGKLRKPMSAIQHRAMHARQRAQERWRP